jgi:hypothetical protein
VHLYNDVLFLGTNIGLHAFPRASIASNVSWKRTLKREGIRVDGQHLIQNKGGQLNQKYDAEGVKQEGQCLSQEKERHYTDAHEWESPISYQTLGREF